MKTIKSFLFFFFIIIFSCLAQQGEAISLQLKAMVYPFDTLDMYGHGKVEALLKYKNGAPIRGKKINMKTSAGILTCKLPDIESEVDTFSGDMSCFTTDKNGKVIAYIINIPYNSMGTIEAYCEIDGAEVSASCNFQVKRTVVKKAVPQKKIFKP
jgi:hypothetical protein